MFLDKPKMYILYLITSAQKQILDKGGNLEFGNNQM